MELPKEVMDLADPDSCNLFLSNPAPQVSEHFLWKEFGKFGSISCIKILEARNEEEKRANKRSAFLGFVERSSAEEAKEKTNGRDFYAQTMSIGWPKLADNRQQSTSQQGKADDLATQQTPSSRNAPQHNPPTSSVPAHHVKAAPQTPPEVRRTLSLPLCAFYFPSKS